MVAMVRNPVVQLLAAGLLVLVAVAAATSVLSRSAADGEAVDDARRLTEVLARSVAEPALPVGLVTGDAGAIDRFDRRALDRLLVGDVLRVKVWSADGVVRYSDRTELVGSRYPLGDDEIAVLEGGGTEAEISDLSRPENRFERGAGGDVLEVYTSIESPEGVPLLFEAYYAADDLRQQRQAILGRFLPITLGAVGALALAAVPLVVLLDRRVVAAGRQRERLLRAAIDASDVERRRIARDLHDGVVQDLAGTALALSTLAGRPGADPAVAAEAEGLAAALRTSMRGLRSLLVGIHPPDLHVAGLAAATADLVAPLSARGVVVDVDVELGADAVPVPEDVVALVWRVAQEAVRNVVHHAAASRVSLTVWRERGAVLLEVVDDGRGFDPAADRPAEHLGLRGLAGLARDAGAHLDVLSAPGAGTTVRLEVPVRAAGEGRR